MLNQLTGTRICDVKDSNCCFLSLYIEHIREKVSHVKHVYIYVIFYVTRCTYSVICYLFFIGTMMYKFPN